MATPYAEAQFGKVYEAISKAGEGGLTRSQVADVLELENTHHITDLLRQMVAVGWLVEFRLPTERRSPFRYRIAEGV